MPIGNITPKTDTFTRASVLLGSEEYPSTVQQAICKNEGYLMYRPLSVWSGASYHHTGDTGPYTINAHAFIIAGKYDIYGASTLTGGANAGTISFSGTVLASGAASATGTMAAFTQAADGWVAVQAIITLTGAAAGVIGWNICTRQYEE